MVGLGAVPAILQFAMLVFRPETPRWLMKANCADEARRVVRKVYGVGYQASRIVEQIVRGIEKEILEEEEAKAQRTGASSATKSKIPRLIHPSDTTTELFAVRGNRRALTIACMLQALQQLCGFVCLYFSLLFPSRALGSVCSTELSCTWSASNISSPVQSMLPSRFSPHEEYTNPKQ